MGTVKTIAEIAAALAAGTITKRAIEAQFGSSFLAEVLAYAAAGVAGSAAVSLVDDLMEETGASGMISDVTGEIKDLFSW